MINILQNPASATATADLKLIQHSVDGLKAFQTTWQQQALYFLAHEVQEIADQAIKRGMELSDNKVHDKRQHDEQINVPKHLINREHINKDFLNPPVSFAEANQPALFSASNFLDPGDLTMDHDNFNELDLTQSLDWWQAPTGLDWENVRCRRQIINRSN